jgi:hypothetical protein
MAENVVVGRTTRVRLATARDGVSGGGTVIV